MRKLTHLAALALSLIVASFPVSAMTDQEGKQLTMAALKGSGVDLARLNSAAESGDSKAQGYLSGYFGAKEDYAKATYWLQKAANQGDATAECGLGNAYRDGKGVPQDYAKAISWYQKAAAHGYVIDVCTKSSFYHDYIGVPRNYNMAALQKFANQGNAAAECALGSVYRDGNGVPVDDVKAFYWYQKAADQGDAPAKFALGHAYYYGRGVPQDEVKAIYWFKQVADQIDASAECGLGHDCSYRQGKVPNSDSTKEGDFKSAYANAFYYLHRDGAPNFKEAANYYQQAASRSPAPECDLVMGLLQGNAKNQEGTDQAIFIAYSTAYSYQHGDGVPQDFTKAAYWYQQGADLGDVTSQYALGNAYYHGQGVTRDSMKALYWLEKAAAHGGEIGKTAQDMINTINAKKGKG